MVIIGSKSKSSLRKLPEP